MDLSQIRTKIRTGPKIRTVTVTVWPSISLIIDNLFETRSTLLNSRTIIIFNNFYFSIGTESFPSSGKWQSYPKNWLVCKTIWSRPGTATRLRADFSYRTWIHSDWRTQCYRSSYFEFFLRKRFSKFHPQTSFNLDGWKYTIVEIGMNHEILMSIALFWNIQTEMGLSLGWIPKNFKACIFKPKLLFLREITKMITGVNSRIFPILSYIWFSLLTRKWPFPLFLWKIEEIINRVNSLKSKNSSQLSFLWFFLENETLDISRNSA